MKKPIIGIVSRTGILKSESKVMQIMDAYRKAVICSGGIPLGILPTQNEYYSLDRDVRVLEMNEDEKVDIIEQIKLCDGIIMPGGCRIFEYDRFICKYALDNNIPILGICLGMQTIAVVDCYPNTTINIINEENTHQSNEEFVHNVTISKESKLYEILNTETFKVNSRHKCEIISTNNFNIVGYSEDGVIEAIEYKEKNFAIGVQWHPENLINVSLESQKLFKEFINKSIEYSKIKKVEKS